MPGWHKVTQPLVESGDLNVIGIAQEQHPERARLFMQWKQMSWPLMVDALDVLDVPVVPITLFIDEYGVIRGLPRKAEALAGYMARTYKDPGPPPTLSAPDLGQLALGEDTRAAQSVGDACFLWGADNKLDQAIAAYQMASTGKRSARAAFRLGVALRRRYETDTRQPQDFGNALKHWTAAVEASANQYIWRRRLQQYGPRLDKPYPFYDWIETARSEITARGEVPSPLQVALTTSESLDPESAGDGSAENEPVAEKQLDPDGKIHRDQISLILVESAMAPTKLWLSKNLAARSRKSQRNVRVHIDLRPNPAKSAHWNNEAEPLTLWLEAPAGLTLDRRSVTIPSPGTAESDEARHVEYEVTADGAKPGQYTLRGYALYGVCEGAGGTCQYLRQDIQVVVTVVP